MKNEDIKDFDKKREIEDVVGPVTNDTFGRLVSLRKKITDYGNEDVAMVDPDMGKKDAEIDDELGVAVVFDEEEQEDDDKEDFEVKDDSDNEDEEGGCKEGEEGSAEGEEGGEEEIVIGGEGKKAKADKDIVSLHVIDGFWVQRQISEIYPDPVTVAEKAGAVLTILGSESNLRDCENQLMELFEFQSFHTVTKFLKNGTSLSGVRSWQGQTPMNG